MNKVIKLVSLLLFPTLLGSGIVAQERVDLEPNISEAWTGLTLSKELSKKFTLDLENQIRFSETNNGVRLNFIALGLDYNFYKGFNAKANYRYSFRNDARNTKRISFDLSYKLKVKSLKTAIKYRVRYQNTQVTYTGESINFLRSKISVTPKISKKWAAFAAYEMFYNLSDEYEHQANRYVIGAKYKLNKKTKLKAYIQYDKDIHGKYRPKKTVLGLMATYEIK